MLLNDDLLVYYYFYNAQLLCIYCIISIFIIICILINHFDETDCSVDIAWTFCKDYSFTLEGSLEKKIKDKEVNLEI